MTNAVVQAGTVVPDDQALDRLQPLRPLDTRQVAGAMATYQDGLASILDKTDWQNFTAKDGTTEAFVTKSGWRKIAMWFSLNLSLIEETIERDEHGRPTRAKVIARATAPNGRYVDGDGHCSATERRFAKPENDIPATASTRAKNRAIADLVGMGRVSAEEIDGAVIDVAPAPPPVWAQAATTTRVDVLRASLAEIGLTPETTQSLIGAWGSAFGLIPDLIVGVARGIAAGQAQQQPPQTPESQENPV